MNELSSLSSTFLRELRRFLVDLVLPIAISELGMRTLVPILMRVWCVLFPERSTVADGRLPVLAIKLGSMKTFVTFPVVKTVRPPAFRIFGFLLRVVHDMTIPPVIPVLAGSDTGFEICVAGDERGDVGGHVAFTVETEEEGKERVQGEVVIAVSFRLVPEIVV
jgi:hypothetical protein